MNIKQLYTKCLAQGAYFIESNGEAVVIDPLREVQQYIDLANEKGATIKYIFETHFHADFVSGHIDLAKKTGATIVYGPTDMPMGFDAHIAKDEETFEVGKVKFKLLHTPGHTMESSCYLLINEVGEQEAIFTGDTLFIGDVGRPDLAQKVSSDLTQDKLARYMFHSLRNKIIPLNDEITVFPAHGAGSACGKNLSKETFDTLGNQKKTNYALNLNLSEDEFVKELTEGLTAPPAYFPENVLLNIQGYDSIDEVLKRGTKSLTLEVFETLRADNDVLVLDTRHQSIFVEGFIPNSWFIGIDGGFAPWVGTLIPNINQKIILIADIGREKEVVTRLARVGYDNTLGYLEGGFDTWKNAGKPIDTLESIGVEETSERYQSGEGEILDVRKESEYDSAHVLNAFHIPLDYVTDNLTKLDKEKKYFVHCAGGYRSVIFSSILKTYGYHKLIDVKGGFGAIKKSDLFDLQFDICEV